jgi:hypothetical protein
MLDKYAMDFEEVSGNLERCEEKLERKKQRIVTLLTEKTKQRQHKSDDGDDERRVEQLEHQKRISTTKDESTMTTDLDADADTSVLSFTFGTTFPGYPASGSQVEDLFQAFESPSLNDYKQQVLMQNTDVLTITQEELYDERKRYNHDVAVHLENVKTLVADKISLRK